MFTYYPPFYENNIFMLNYLDY